MNKPAGCPVPTLAPEEIYHKPSRLGELSPTNSLQNVQVDDSNEWGFDECVRDYDGWGGRLRYDDCKRRKREAWDGKASEPSGAGLSFMLKLEQVNWNTLIGSVVKTCFYYQI